MERREKFDLPKSRFEIFLDLFSLLIFAAAVIFLFANYGSLPDEVPGHYNAAGEVDRWGSKAELWILPAVAFGLWILATVLEKFPHTYNYLNLTTQNAPAQYKNGRLMVNVLKNECVLLFSYLTFQNVRIALGQAEGLSAAFMPVFLGVIFGSVFIFIFRMLRL